MNIRQHISIHLERITRALLPGGCWRLGQIVAEFSPAEPVAIRATKHQPMPRREFNRSDRKA